MHTPQSKHSFCESVLSESKCTVDGCEAGEDHEEGGGEEDRNEESAKVRLDLYSNTRNYKGVDQHIEQTDTNEQSNHDPYRYQIFEPVYA